MAKAKKILIIEDEKALSRALSLKLQSEGFEVEVANDGELGLAAIKKFKPNLIILDLVMPKFDGFEVLAKIKGKKVVVISNLSQDEDIEKAKKLGAKEYFIKSNVSLVDVVNKIKTIV